MRNLKKFLALVLAMMMTLSLMVTVNASSFKDDDEINSNYAEAVNVLSELGVVNGYKDGDTVTFDPKANITRAEVAAILYRVVTGDVDGDNIHLYNGFSEFSDVAGDKWYTPYVNFCANNGLVNGVGNNRFAPSANVTGYEALVMILRAIGYNNPTEFSSSDWKFKASGYGTRLGITNNIPAGSLGASATREMVAEIMFQGLLVPTVTYSPLTLYTENLLVDASKVNPADGTKIYAADVKSTLMYETFKIVGKRYDVANDTITLGMDNYGRPAVEWVKDAPDDTVANGGKYIVNPVAAAAVAATAAAKGDGSDNDADAAVNAGEAYIPRNAWGATYSCADADMEDAALTIPLTPVKTYYDVVTECQLSKDVNKDRTIPAANVTEWLNGRVVATRGTALDALHTATGDGAPTIGAPGRTTEVYRIASDPRPAGSDTFVIVYVDTMMGVVGSIVARTFDTAGHVMQPARMTIKVNQDVTVTKTSRTSDFSDWKAGDLILLTTYGGQNWSANSGGRPSGTANHADKATGLDPTKIQTIVPQRVHYDFTWYDDANVTVANKDVSTWAIDILDEKPTTVTFTADATVGKQRNKTGLISTDKQTYMANIVYLANQNDPANNGGVSYYMGHPNNTITTETTVPMTNTNYGVKMANEDIGRTFTAVRDPRGYVVGLTEAVAAKGIGVITALDTVKVGTGKYAIEAEMFMIDGSTQTVRFVDNDPTDTALGDGNKTNTTGANDDSVVGGKWDFFPKASDADDSVNGTAKRNLGINVNVLIQIEPFTMAGATYYKVLATGDLTQNYWVGKPGAMVPPTDGGGNKVPAKVETGVADTLDGITTYDSNPSNKVTHNIDDNTKFIIAEMDYRYNYGQGNVGGYTDFEYKAYKGFKNIPTIESDNAGTDETDCDILWQRIGNNVFIYPNMDASNTNKTYTMKNGATYAVDETYLVLAPVATYAEYSTYKVLKDGQETTLNVSNNNITSVNNKVEAAMNAHQLISVASTNTRGYVTDVSVYSTAYNAAGSTATPHSRTFDDGDLDGFDKTGVMHFVEDKVADPFNQAATDEIRWLTVADGCTVQIVNLLTGTYVDGTLDSVIQYKTHTSDCDFVYELDAHGYISHIYIID